MITIISQYVGLNIQTSSILHEAHNALIDPFMNIQACNFLLHLAHYTSHDTPQNSFVELFTSSPTSCFDSIKELFDQI